LILSLTDACAEKVFIPAHLENVLSVHLHVPHAQAAPIVVLVLQAPQDLERLAPALVVRSLFKHQLATVKAVKTAVCDAILQALACNVLRLTN
jgi:hypothetical protein